ncbi:MAG: FKBP-type 22 kDa peptidyl-prolyl cis-trans isomerase [Bacteroidetes bacterium ADurb.Bin217]|nr:MAG: FKBP-type 22 kDa peptidyl-prolyl cis-trans isomerase [Bacteroidetes bacterium ADurb.Bin217]
MYVCKGFKTLYIIELYTMRNVLIVFVVSLLFASCSNADKYKKLETSLDSTSYSLGLLFASKIPQNLEQNNIDSISFQHFIQGIRDYFDSTGTTVLTQEESQKLVQRYIEQIMSSSNKAYASQFLKNETEGNIYLDNNKKNQGVIELQKGLQYQVYYAGWGQLQPDVRDTILVHFKILNTSQKVLFDSRSKSSEPIKLPMDSAITAFKRVLPLVYTGAKLRIFSSHEFAYGTQVTKKDVIEPYQTLLFDIELVKTLKGNYTDTSRDSLYADTVKK